MYAQEVFLGQFPLELTHGFYEGLRLHVTHGAADLGDYHVEIAGLAEEQHPALDFVGDMGDYLHRLAKICAFALFGKDGVVYLAGGDVVRLRHEHTKEAFVVAKVQVGLRSILRHVAFSVFIRIQRSGVDVDVGVEFLDSHTQSACLEELCQGCRHDTFSK